MCCTGLLFLYQAVQGTHTALKHTRRWCKNVQVCCFLIGGARNTHGIKNTRGCCKNMLHRSAVFFTRQCKENTRHSKHTRGCFLHQAVQGTHTTFKIHQWVVKNCITLVCCFFTGQCNEQTRHSKHTRGCCKIVLPWSAVSLPGSSRNTHSIQNSPEGD
jgi:hypothetical protein